MKTFNFLAFVMLCIGYVLPVKAQYSVKDAFAAINFISLPHTAAKGIVYPQWVGIDNPNNFMDDKMYNDFQCTDYFSSTTDPDLSPALYAKFQVPGTSWILGAVAFGGAIDNQTVSLIVVDSNGNIKSSLVAEVKWGWIPARQFKITQDGKVIVTKLIPTASQSIRFDKFSQMTAYRLDEVYRIDTSGRFVKESEKRFNTKTYTKAQLDNGEYNIWDL